MKKLSFIIFHLFSVLSFLTAGERPIVNSINASTSKENQIMVSWILSEEDSSKITKILIFKNNKPINSAQDISEEQPAAVLEPNTLSWTDKVEDYKTYYYAVITEKDGIKYDIVLPSINATVSGVHLKIPENKHTSLKDTILEARNKRAIPLPYLDLIEYTSRKNIKMSKEAISAATALAGDLKNINNVPMNIHVFEEDLISPDSGDDVLLFEVLRETFIKKRYNDAIIQLEKLLSANRSTPVSERAAFYLGESYYYIGNYKNSIMLFLSVYNSYPVLSKCWIDSALDFMIIPKESIFSK